MSEKAIHACHTAGSDLQTFRTVAILHLRRVLAGLRGILVFSAIGAPILLSACAGGGGGSGGGGGPSQPGGGPSAPPPPPEPPDGGAEPPPPPAPLSIPLGSSVDSAVSPLARTALRFGGAFGSGPNLGRVVAFDNLGRTHWVDLGGRTRAEDPALNLLDWLSSSNRELGLVGQVAQQLSLGLNFLAPVSSSVLEGMQNHDHELSNNFALTAEFDRSRISLLRAWDIERNFGFSAEAATDQYGLIGDSAFGSPYLSLMGTGDGLVFRQEISEATFAFRFGFATERSPQSTKGRGDAKVWVGELIGRHANGSWIGLQLGSTLEGNRLLGSEGNGALELPSTSTTLFAGLAGSLHLNDRLDFFGQANVGFTDPADSALGLIRDISGLRSSSFGLGVLHRELLAADDRLTVALSQPLRIDAGTAILDRPVGLSPDGRVLRQRERVSLEPDGREIDIEVGYSFPLGTHFNMALNWLGQLEPGHNRDASPAHTLAVKLRTDF